MSVQWLGWLKSSLVQCPMHFNIFFSVFLSSLLSYLHILTTLAYYAYCQQHKSIKTILNLSKIHVEKSSLKLNQPPTPTLQTINNVLQITNLPCCLPSIGLPISQFHSQYVKQKRNLSYAVHVHSELIWILYIPKLDY